MNGGHAHGGEAEAALNRRTRQVLRAVLVATAVLAGIGVVALWPGPVESPEDQASTVLGFDVELVKAEVSAVEAAPCAGAELGAEVPSPDAPSCVEVSALVTSGAPEGEVATFEMVLTDVGARLAVGDRVVLTYAADAPAGQQYQFSDFERDRSLVVLAVVFAVAVVALGRWKGVRALAGVVLTLVTLAVFVLPALLNGSNPVVVATVASVLLAFVALYLTHGVSDTTTVALTGTLASVLLTGLLGWLFVGLTDLTGFADEESAFLSAIAGGIDVRGILLAGIVIGSLGVLDDVTVTQVSAVNQLRRANPGLSRSELYGRGLAVGRDHVASTVNTLVLAYAGASLPLLLLFTQTGQSIRTVLTSEVVAAEIVRTLVGSIGIVVSVPLTTWLAAITVGAGGVEAQGGSAAPPSAAGNGGERLARSAGRERGTEAAEREQPTTGE